MFEPPSPGRPSLLLPVAACNSGLAMVGDIPEWWEDELVEAMKFAIWGAGAEAG